MSFDWNEYFTLAQELSQAKGGTRAAHEARLRSAVSRSYYSVFCSARNYLTRKNVRPPKQEIHMFVKDQYLNSTDTAKRQIGSNLDRLRIYRNKADEGLDNTAVLHIAMARMTIDELSKLK